MDHEWPAELNPDSRCEYCGLAYRFWNENDKGCPA